MDLLARIIQDLAIELERNGGSVSWREMENAWRRDYGGQRHYVARTPIRGEMKREILLANAAESASEISSRTGASRRYVYRVRGK